MQTRGTRICCGNKIKSSPFFTMQMGETANISEKSQCSIILRYVDENGDIIKSFFSCYDVSAGKTADDIYELLKKNKISTIFEQSL